MRSLHLVLESLEGCGTWEHGGQEGLKSWDGLNFFPVGFPCLLQVDEIYHDESLGVHINIVLVRMIMVGYRQVNPALGCGRQDML